MNDLIIIDPKQYGIEQKRADEIAEAFREPLADLVLSINEKLETL